MRKILILFIGALSLVLYNVAICQDFSPYAEEPNFMTPKSTPTPPSDGGDQETPGGGDSNNQGGETECPNGCCGIKLNTDFPIIGNCIETSNGEGSNPTNVFPKMMSALTKIAMSLILVACFIIIIVAGVMRAGAGDDNSKATQAKGLITKVAITILLLGFSGAILRLINPNFFG